MVSKNMTKTKIVIEFVSLLIVLDVLILTASLAQVAIEGRTGMWNGFWTWQAEKVVGFLQ